MFELTPRGDIKKVEDRNTLSNQFKMEFIKRLESKYEIKGDVFCDFILKKQNACVGFYYSNDRQATGQQGFECSIG